MEIEIVKYDYSKFIDKKEECKYWQKEILDHITNISVIYVKLIKRKILIDNNIFHNKELKQFAEGIENNYGRKIN